MIKDNRISFIASLIKGDNNILIDIGTDHGYLIKEAFSLGKIKKAIATDINKEPLLNAKRNLKDLNVTFYQTDGFKNIKENYNKVVIAGMGANLISKILNDAKTSKDITYYLQPNNKEKNLRKYLMDNNFKIVDEFVIFDKKYYVIIKAIRGSMNLSKEDLILGPILKTKKESINYYKHLIKWYNTIIKKHNLKDGSLVDEYNLLNRQIKNKGR